MNLTSYEEEQKEWKRNIKNRGQEADGKKGSPPNKKPNCGTKTMPT